LLIGRLLFDSLNNLGVGFDRLRELEPDAALGNGGLGRLAARCTESVATLSFATHGDGIRDDRGMVRQVIQDGWLTGLSRKYGCRSANPWEVVRARWRATPSVSEALLSHGPALPTPRAASGIRPKQWLPRIS
jgi:glucan phosphorylase